VFGTWCKYHKAFTLYKSLKTVERSQKSIVVVLYGPTGTGKSSWIYKHFPKAYWKPARTSWFDGYDNHEIAVLDEFYGWLPYDLLLRLFDRYPMQVEIKGGHAQWVPKIILVTSNKPPHEWYDSEKCPLPPLQRRLDHIWELSELDKPARVLKGLEPDAFLKQIEESDIDALVEIFEQANSVVTQAENINVCSPNLLCSPEVSQTEEEVNEANADLSPEYTELEEMTLGFEKSFEGTQLDPYPDFLLGIDGADEARDESNQIIKQDARRKRLRQVKPHQQDKSSVPKLTIMEQFLQHKKKK